MLTKQVCHYLQITFEYALFTNQKENYNNDNNVD